MSNCISNYINKHGINRKKIAVSIIVSIALISLIQLVKGIGLRNPGFIEKYFSNGTYLLHPQFRHPLQTYFHFRYMKLS